MCPPGNASAPRADTQVGPYKTSIYPQKPGGDRAPPLPVPPKPSIDPGKTEYLSAKPANQLSILNSQLSIVHSSRKFTITNYHPPGGPYV